MTDEPLPSPERGSFRRLIVPIIEHDPLLSLTATTWWITRAKENPEWLEEDLAGLPAVQRDELRALVEADHA